MAPFSKGFDKEPGSSWHVRELQLIVHGSPPEEYQRFGRGKESKCWFVGLWRSRNGMLLWQCLHPCVGRCGSSEELLLELVEVAQCWRAPPCYFPEHQLQRVVPNLIIKSRQTPPLAAMAFPCGFLCLHPEKQI